MFRKDKLSLYLLISFLIHAIIAVAISRIYADQPQSQKSLRIVSAVKIQYKEIDVQPKPKVINKVQPERTEAVKKTQPIKQQPKKVTQPKIEPPEVVQQKSKTETELQAWEAALLASKGKSGGGSPGSSGSKGTVGTPGDRPGMRSVSGIESAVASKTGGSGLATDRKYGDLMVPKGKSSLPGGGGDDLAGFKFGYTKDGKGLGNANIPGRGGSGGTGGLGNDGPGKGLSTGTGTIGTGTGKGTGIGLGDGGTGEMGTGGIGDGSGSGTGSGKGTGSGGPGTSGYDLKGSRSSPNIITQSREVKESQELPKKKEITDDKKAGNLEKESFKTDLGKGMTNVKTEAPPKPADTGYENALQDEINKDLHSLRRMYEDWQNLKLPDIPKSLQITISLDSDKGNPKILSIDFHNASLHSQIKDDLTKKIKEWKFKSLFDGKNDPTKWPIKLTGKISWQ